MISMQVINNRLFDYGLPATATPGAAGYDLRAAIDIPLVLHPERSYRIPTGVALDMGCRDLGAFIFPRSGLSAKYDLTLQNCVGVIDSDYQGEISVLLRNEGEDLYRINPGDRIAQMIFMPVVHPIVGIVQEFVGATQRGTRGFGHTGISGVSSATGVAALNAVGNEHEPGTQDDVLRFPVSPGDLLTSEDDSPGVIPDILISEPYKPTDPPTALDDLMEGHDDL